MGYPPHPRRIEYSYALKLVTNGFKLTRTTLHLRTPLRKILFLRNVLSAILIRRVFSCPPHFKANFANHIEFSFMKWEAFYPETGDIKLFGKTILNQEPLLSARYFYQI